MAGLQWACSWWWVGGRRGGHRGLSQQYAWKTVGSEMHVVVYVTQAFLFFLFWVGMVEVGFGGEGLCYRPLAGFFLSLGRGEKYCSRSGWVKDMYRMFFPKGDG